MYAPPYTRWDDREAALALAAEHNFATLITVLDGQPFASHLPFLIDCARGVLRGHLARANPHSEHLDGCEHLAVFVGPHAYVSPAWYGEAREDVPTWNYVTAHISGGGRVLTDDEAVDRFLADLSEHEERQRADLSAGGRIWTMDKVPPREIERMRRAIVAFEIDIARVEAKAKLSQNKPKGVAARVAEVLERHGGERERATAAQMRRALEGR